MTRPAVVCWSSIINVARTSQAFHFPSSCLNRTVPCVLPRAKPADISSATGKSSGCIPGLTWSSTDSHAKSGIGSPTHRMSCSVLRLTIEPTGISTTELGKVTGLARPTAHRLLTSLAAEGLVDRDARTGRWSLGPELYLLGAAAGNRYDITDRARDIVDDLARVTGESAFLSARRGDETVCILSTRSARSKPKPRSANSSRSGSASPTSCGSVSRWPHCSSWSVSM